MRNLRSERSYEYNGLVKEAFPRSGRDCLVDEILNEMSECKTASENFNKGADWDLSIFEDREDFHKIGRFAKYMKDWILESEC